jgi:hypothetical protein
VSDYTHPNDAKLGTIIWKPLLGELKGVVAFCVDF